MMTYETYLCCMRQIGETNLNLDMVDLLANPPCQKLHTQLVKHPQEVIPTMDQVLKDLMLKIADMDQQAGMQGMQGSQAEEEIADIMGKIYKVGPKAVNMRELNPTGIPLSLSYLQLHQNSWA